MLRSFSRNLYSNLRQRSCLHTSPVARESFTSIKEEDGVREITLNHPKTRNALSLGMMDSLIKGINNNLNDNSLRCIVISSTGPVFSAGHNFKEMTDDKDSSEHRKIFDKCAELVLSIHTAPVPVIAKVDGHAAAAGCQLVASCDMIICSDKSHFSTPGVNFGLFCNTPGVAIGRVMPRMKASYMLLTGMPISAEDAYIAGLVSAVVPSEHLDKKVAKICESIKSKSRPVVESGKKFFYKQLGMNIRDAYDKASQAMADNLQLDDGKEGVRSFLEKRKPKWSDS